MIPTSLPILVRRAGAALVLAALAAPGCRKAPSPAVTEIVLAGNRHPDRVLRGVYEGREAWRWTAPEFAVSLDPPAAATRETYLEMDFTVPEELLREASEVTVTATVNHVEVARKTYRAAGRTALAGKAAQSALSRRPAEVRFQVDRSFTDPATSRAQSLIVVSIGLKEYEQTAAFREAEMAKARQAYQEAVTQRALQVPPDKQRDMMRLFHDLPVWRSMWFHNVPVLKNPLDLWMLQQIAYEVRPDFVIETGTWRGGSALYWAHTLNGMGLENARVLTVDLQDLTQEGAASHPLWKKYVEFFRSSSTDPRLVAGIADRVKGRRVLVNLDSDHSMDHVLRELRMYGPLVSPGSYMAVEDTHLDGVPTHPEQGPGPTAAIRRFLAESGGKAFEQDFTREAAVLTAYPGGWLRRKR